jgi:hypothetical protein
LRTFKSGGSTKNFGDVQRLPGGNTLVTYGNAHVMQEVDANDGVVLAIEGDGFFGYTEFRPSLYGPPVDITE